MSIGRRAFLTITSAAASVAGLGRGANAAASAIPLDARAVCAVRREPMREAVTTPLATAGRCASSHGVRSWHGGFTLADFAP